MNRTTKLCLLAALFAVCATAAFFQHALERRWQSTPPNELYDVVWKQLSAFRTEDYSGAYQQVSMGFQEKFNIEAFADLVRTEYPELVRARRVEFGGVRFEGRRAFIPAYFFMPEGEIVPCVYSLVREEDGWKIDTAKVLKRWPSNRRLGGVRA
jgi:hypothetical protein